jgi:mono/diheme cytochrome c family protein
MHNVAQGEEAMVIRMRPMLGLFVAAALTCGTAEADFDAAGYYKMRCASCHGRTGEGTDQTAPSLGPALRGNALVKNAPVPVIAQIIRKGRSGKARVYDSHYPNMPSFGAEAVPDVDALVAYLKGPLQLQQ